MDHFTHTSLPDRADKNDKLDKVFNPWDALKSFLC